MSLEKLAPGLHCDGLNLYLQVTPAGNRSWLFRYFRNGRARAMGLGPLHTVSLKEARRRAANHRLTLTEGCDPIEVRERGTRAERIEAARAITFESCAERYITAHQTGWRNPKHRAQWKSTLESYVYPTIGKLPVSAIDTALTLQVLERIWTKRPETASRIRGRIEAVLDWASAREYRQGENPARWRGHLDKLLPAKSKIARVKHHAALPYKDVPAFMAELRNRDSLSARALAFCALTAARTGEVIGVEWDEIDPTKRIWSVPAHRMKAGREHRVPLSDSALEVIRALPRVEGCPYIFPGGRNSSHLSNMAMAELLKGMRPGLTVHGFRSSFKDWATETTNHSRDIVESALAHIVGDKVEAAYRRGDALEKRRALMADWAEFCGNGHGDQVLALAQSQDHR